MKGFHSNNDGAGIMYSRGGELIIEKGIFESFLDFRKLYDRGISLCNNSSVVVHFRIATSGEKTEENCHPFRINKSIGFAHNGIFSAMSSYKQTKSDTAVFSDFISTLPDNFYSNEAIMFLIEDFIKKERSKVVFMDSEGQLKLINSELGEWKDGCWYSRKTYTYLPSSGNCVNLLCECCNVVQSSIQNVNFFWNGKDTHHVCDSCKGTLLQFLVNCPKCGARLDVDNFCSSCEEMFTETELLRNYFREDGFPQFFEKKWGKDLQL